MKYPETGELGTSVYIWYGGECEALLYNYESEKLESEQEYLSSSFKRENEFGTSRHK